MSKKDTRNFEAPVTTEVKETTQRLVSLDVFRGLTMLFMASEILRIPEVAHSFSGNALARFIGDMLDHREWVGCTPWDLIQPSFMFMVGVSLPFSSVNLCIFALAWLFALHEDERPNGVV